MYKAKVSSEVLFKSWVTCGACDYELDTMKYTREPKHFLQGTSPAGGIHWQEAMATFQMISLLPLFCLLVCVEPLLSGSCLEDATVLCSPGLPVEIAYRPHTNMGHSFL